MNKWIQKMLVVTVSILTFGLVTPAQLNHYVNAGKTDNEAIETNIQTASIEQPPLPEPLAQEENVIEEFKKQAEMLSFQKFGTKIKPVIEDEFREVILPNINKVLESMAGQIPAEELQNLAISEHPGKGRSEKIFHVTNRETNTDLLRFHVRRDNPPQAGYWFNFHYHTAKDNFQSHQELGAIYWAKNTPPKWMS
ncbi:YpjP family protein [Neobacillus sp. SM06]|uniref:YpjP family protein n=1 Tax=Neobacillus sp. SM06 TaxID=3422492 RepID=UPI003D29239C